jgi:hypothetical protein
MLNEVNNGDRERKKICEVKAKRELKMENSDSEARFILDYIEKEIEAINHKLYILIKIVQKLAGERVYANCDEKFDLNSCEPCYSYPGCKRGYEINCKRSHEIDKLLQEMDKP